MSDQEMLTFSKDLRFAKIPAKINFLVLDDLKAMQIAISRDIKRIGFKGDFYGASTIGDAIEGLKKFEINFIFVDCNLLNGELGIDFLKYVRKSPKYSKLPVLMLTTVSEVSNILIAIGAGASGYIVKPWELNDLKEKIAHAYNEYINA
jgi:two-component system chemotaxis response regulator CheY